MSTSNAAPPKDGFWVKFWGVRGSIPCADPSFSRYGGNTACLEVRCDSETLVFDMGSGAHGLGHDLIERGVTDIDIFFTHAHFDHVMGVPFFRPFYRSDFSARLWGGPLEGISSIRDMVAGLMRPPYLPITPEIFSARIEYRELMPRDLAEPKPGVSVRTTSLNHPGGCLGYRIDFGGKSICYITDTEHVPGVRDESIISFIDRAEIVIYDATFTDEEFMPCRGFGHSTWREGATLCDAANAGLFVVFHHNTEHDDDAMDAIAEELRQVRPNSEIAREGLVLAP